MAGERYSLSMVSLGIHLNAIVTCREKNHGAMKRHERAMERHEQNRSRKNNNLLRDPTMFAGNGNAASKSSNSDESELKVVLSSKDHIQKPEQHLIKKVKIQNNFLYASIIWRKLKFIVLIIRTCDGLWLQICMQSYVPNIIL